MSISRSASTAAGAEPQGVLTTQDLEFEAVAHFANVHFSPEDFSAPMVTVWSHNATNYIAITMPQRIKKYTHTFSRRGLTLFACMLPSAVLLQP